MQITHRAQPEAPARPSTATGVGSAKEALVLSLDKAPRLSCCCRLSELLPKVREVHDAVRAARLATEAAPGVAA